MIRSFRPWMGTICASLLLLLLHLIPYTGIILSFLGPDRLFGYLLDLSFILIAADCARCKIPRWFFVFPVFWFGGYLLTTIISHIEFTRFNKHLVQDRNLNLLHWNPNAEDVLFPANMSTGTGDVITAENLLIDFNINSVYAAGYAPPSEGSGWLYNLVHSSCENNWQQSLTSSALSTSHPPLGLGQNWCEIRSRGNPTKPAISITPDQRITITRGILKTRRQNIQIVEPSGKRLILTWERAQPLSWIPAPTIGCLLIDEPPSYRCTIEFSYAGPVEISEPSISEQPISVVASALGLSLRVPSNTRG